MSGQDLAGILDVRRALEGGFKKVAELGHDSHEEPEKRPFEEGKVRAPEQISGDERGQNRGDQTGGRPFRAFFRADGGPYSVFAELDAGGIGRNVRQGGNQHDEELFPGL